MSDIIPTNNREVEVDVPSSTFKVSNIEDFVNKEIPPREYLLKPWLPEQGLTMVYAPRGLGKTHFALEVALAVATEGGFLSWKAPKAQKVLYIDGEMPACDLQKRIRQICLRRGKVSKNYFEIMTPDEQSGAMPDLSDELSQRELERYTDAKLIIIDNISTLCRSGNENEAESWLTVQKWALRMRASGKAVLFVHHAGKGGAQRGTSKREDTLDSVLALKHPKDYEARQGARFEIHFEKSRGFNGDDAEPLEASLSIDENLGYQWSFGTVSDGQLARIVELHYEGLSQTEIADEVGVSKSTVSRKMSQAKIEGKL